MANEQPMDDGEPKHTQEPWRAGKNGGVVADAPVPEMAGSDVVEYYGGHLICESVTPSNMRRIVACVNACAGMPTSSLERLAVGGLHTASGDLSTGRVLKPIPIEAAKLIADEYGYDQVVIIARRVGNQPDPCGEHVTTYGANAANSLIAARIGRFIKHKIMGWPEEEAGSDAPRDRIPGA